jgi:hypothetical protein
MYFKRIPIEEISWTNERWSCTYSNFSNESLEEYFSYYVVLFYSMGAWNMIRFFFIFHFSILSISVLKAFLFFFFFFFFYHHHHLKHVHTYPHAL